VSGVTCSHPQDYGGAYTWDGLPWESAQKLVGCPPGYKAINMAAVCTLVMGEMLLWLEGGALPPPGRRARPLAIVHGHRHSAGCGAARDEESLVVDGDTGAWDRVWYGTEEGLSVSA
jgi:hypothetical protein